MDTERDYLFDNIKACLIFLVVAGHVLESYMYQSRACFTVYGMIYSFHMPLFIFIVGYFSTNTEKCGRTAYREILLPYLVFNTFYYLVKSAIHQKFVFSIVTPGWIYWFLLSLFFWKVCIGRASKIKHGVALFIIASIAAGLFSDINNTLSFSRTLCFFAFFLAGFHCGKPRIDRIRKHPFLSALITVAVLSAVGYYFYRQNGGAYSALEEMFYMNDSYRHLGINMFRGAVFRTIIIATAFILIFSITGFFPGKKIPVISRIGQNSITVYIFHAYIIIALRQLFPAIETPVQAVLFIGVLPVAVTLILSRDIVSAAYRNAMDFISRST